tara:strand:+ start:579 stop:899 length:321 start_codon:yes stop_codon:yes gene_type:complete
MKKTLALLAFMSSCQSVYAQGFGSMPFESCGKTETVRNVLIEQFNQSSTFKGLKGSIHLDELFYNETSGTYAFVRSNIEAGVSCVLSSGAHGQVTETPAVKVKPNL